MAVPLVIPNAALLTLRWTGPARAWNNVLGLTGNPTVPVVDQGLTNAVAAMVNAQLTASGLLTHLASTVIFEGIALRDISAANRPEFTSPTNPLAGGGTGDMLPLSLASCVTNRTALAGKSFRGRTYFSGYVEAENTAAGRISTAANTATVNFMELLRTNLTTVQFRLAVLSRPVAAVTIPAVTRPSRTGQANAVTVCIARDEKWESQRRRTGRS